MSKKAREFDAVEMMRAARDKISKEIEGMTLDEELRWLSSQEIGDPFLRRLRERIADKSNATARPSSC
jgi:FtsZ-interacting cell division protein ZipA